jgi:O-antigen/teichoic acid export membrane protein
MTEAIGGRIRSGVAWKAASQVTLQLSRMIVALILARLLAPHDWGLAAMVLIVSGFVVVFTDSALFSALIQRRNLRDEDSSTVFWLSAAIGVVLVVCGLALAGPLADFYGEPAVEPLFMALSVTFLVNSLKTTHTALLTREMQFRTLELRWMGASVVGAAVGVTVALADYGAWAIVGQQIAESVAFLLLIWFATPWRPSMTFSMASLRSLAGFTGNVFGENVLYQAGRNLSGLLIGRFLGPASVGAYALATNVILVPFSRIAAPLQQVFFPAFSQLSGDRERMADIWIRATRLVGLISIPSLVGLAIVAPDFVEVVLGPRWSDATPVIQILAVVGLIQSLQTLSGEVLLALGRANWLFRFTIVWFVGSVSSFVVGLEWGIVGVAAAFTVATVVIEPLRTYLAARALGISPWRLPHALAGVAQAAAVMGIGVLVARSLLIEAGVNPLGRLLILVAFGLGLYAAGCLWRARDIVGEIAVAFGRRSRRKPRLESLEPPLFEQ